MIGLSKQELDDMFLQSFMDIHNQRKADIHNQNPYPNIPKQLADLMIAHDARIAAYAGAVLQIIAANNERIEAQLKDRGIQI